MTIGSRISALRKQLGLSQDDVADKIGVSRQSVSKWETDTSAPDAFNLIALSEVLNTSVEYIVTGKTVEEQKVDVKPSTQPQSATKRSNLSILGFILVIGGIVMALIGIFVEVSWSIIGAFVAALGCICALCKKKSLFIGFMAFLAVAAVLVVLMLTL